MYASIHRMRFVLQSLILTSFLAILVECFSDVIVNNNKLNLTGYSGLMHSKNLTLNSIRNIFQNNKTSGAKSKKSFQNSNHRPKPTSTIRDYLITKYNFIQPSVVTINPNSVITVNNGADNSEYNQNNFNYVDNEIAQANLLNFLNISKPLITSTERVPYGQSIEVPEVSAYEITNSPNYYLTKPVPVPPNIIYNTHQYYDFLNYAVPPVEENFMTTQRPPLNQIKPTTFTPITTARPTIQIIKNTNKNDDDKNIKPQSNQHRPTPSTPVFIFTYPDKHKKPSKKPQQKKRKKHIKPQQSYVLTESPFIAAIENTFESVYNYFEDLFTDTVQYPAHEETEVVEVESQSNESHKRKPKQKKRKKIHDLQATKKPDPIPLPYITSDESDSSDSSSSSWDQNDSNSYYDSASSEENSKKTLRTIVPTKSTVSLKAQTISKPIQIRTTARPKNYKNKLSTKRITVRSLNTQTNKAYTTPISIKSRRATTKMASKGSSKGLITHVHIRNEFIEPTTPINPELNKSKVKKVDDSNESSSDYYDDYFGFSSPDDDDDDEAETSQDPSTNVKIQKKSKKKSNKKKFSNENYNDDDYDSMFMLPPISNLLPSLPSFPGFNNKETFSEVHGRSTTPNNIYTGTHDQESNKQSNPFIWYPPMFGYGIDETTTAITLMLSSTTESSPWFQSWFNDKGSNEIATEAPSTTTESSNSWWFPWLADDDDEDDEESNALKTTTTQATTTTTKSMTQPLFVIPNPMPNAASFITFLTEKIKPKPTAVAELENPYQKMHYNRYQLWRLFPQSTDDVATLEEYRMSFDDSTEVQWWKGPALRSTTEIIVSPNMTEHVKEFLNDEYIKYEIIMKDVQTAILYENPKISNHEQLQIEIQQGHPLTWHRYQSYDEIVKFLEYLHRKHPDYVELIHLGQSYEGRPLIVVKIHFDEMFAENSKTPSKSKLKFMKGKLKKIKKKAVFIECGVHGREWMSPAVGTWILNSLVKFLLQNTTIGETIRSVDWYILPVMNPDGYQYSFEFDRFWRKTRSNHKTNQFNLLTTAMNWMKSKDHTPKTCYGVDPNRNWNVDWGVRGGSHSKCSEFYMGAESNSEPEIKALAKFLMDYRKRIKLFLSLHSYGQFISYPAMSNATYGRNEIHDVMDMVLVAIEALRNSDSAGRYKVDTTNDMMSARSGTSDAFAMHEAGIKYSYILELRDTGHHGLLIPASYIESSAKSAFEMIKAMVDYL